MLNSRYINIILIEFLRNIIESFNSINVILGPWINNGTITLYQRYTYATLPTLQLRHSTPLRFRHTGCSNAEQPKIITCLNKNSGPLTYINTNRIMHCFFISFPISFFSFFILSFIYEKKIKKRIYVLKS